MWNDDDEMFEFNARYDDHRERYGDLCPACHSLRWGGDCPRCSYELVDNDGVVIPYQDTPEEIAAFKAMVAASPELDDDIPF